MVVRQEKRRQKIKTSGMILKKTSLSYVGYTERSNEPVTMSARRGGGMQTNFPPNTMIS